MRSIKKANLYKSVGGAVLFQVLLGLGLMVLMSPIIFKQIQKYNEEVQREEVIANMETFQKAVTSFIIFEKDKMSAGSYVIPDRQVKFWSGNEMKSVLSDYLGSASVPLTNGFGQEYSFITYRNGEVIEAVVVASGGGVDELTLNGIGQFLFDKGAVLAADGTLLSDLKLSSNLQSAVNSLVSSTGSGALVMFVSDAFFSSDYLHIAEMSGDSSRSVLFNTMIVDLNMSNNDIKDVANLYGTNLISVLENSVNVMSLSDVVFKDSSDVKNIVEYKNTSGIDANNTLPIVAQGTSGDGSIYIEDMVIDNSSHTSEFSMIDMPDGELETNQLMANDYIVLGNVEVESGWNSVSLNSLDANTLSSSDGTVEDVINRLEMIDDTSITDKDSFIYVGSYSEQDGNKIYSEANSLNLNLSGTSEINDVCASSGANCLSDNILNVYLGLQEVLENYCEKRGGCENLTD